MALDKSDLMLAALIEAKGEVLSRKRLVRAIYPRPEVPPANAEGNLNERATRLRQEGYPIECVRGAGFRLLPAGQAAPEANVTGKIVVKPKAEPRAVPDRRKCLGPCRKPFSPEHAGNFVCQRCDWARRDIAASEPFALRMR